MTQTATGSTAYAAAVAALKELAELSSFDGTTTAGYRVLEEINRLHAVLAAAENTVLAAVAEAELENSAATARAAGKKLPPCTPEAMFDGQHISFRSLHQSLAQVLGRTPGKVRKQVRDARYFAGPLRQSLAAMWAGELAPAQGEQIAQQHYILQTTAAAAVNNPTDSDTEDPSHQAGSSHAWESALLEQAANHPGGSFATLARTLREQHHPDSVAPAREKAQRERFISITPQSDGMAKIFGMLPLKDLSGLDQMLDARTRSVLNRAADTVGRTRGQIKADEFLALLRRTPSTTAATSGSTESSPDSSTDAADRSAQPTAIQPPSAESPSAQVLVTIPVEYFLAAGGVLPSDVAARLRNRAPAPQMVGYGALSGQEALDIAAATPTWETLLTHPVSGEMLALGRKRYRPPTKLRRALQARDGTCRIPGCQTPATMCQVDHVDEFHDGGTSDPPNLISLCFHHHQLKSAGRWRIEHATNPPDGSLKITLPDGTVQLVPPTHNGPPARLF